MAYVYRHIRLDKNEPFYIGIGSDSKYQRASSRINRNKLWNNIVAKTDYDIEVILDNLSWDEACKKEIEFIELYGRIDINSGTLANLTNGGDGVIGAIRDDQWRKKQSLIHTGRKQAKLTDDHKRKISEANKGRKLSDEAKRKISEANKGKPCSDEKRNKIIQKLKGSKLTEEHKQNISNAHRIRNKINKYEMEYDIAVKLGF